MKSDDVLKVVANVVIICGGIIGALGTVTNSISLSYFIRRNEKGVSRGLFIFLNVFDLIVCVSEVLSLAFYYCEDPDLCGIGKLPFKVVFTVFDVSVETTGFATCLLGVTRVISVCFPFYKINGKVLTSVKATFISIEIVRAIIRVYFFADLSETEISLSLYGKIEYTVMIILLTLFILVNTTSTVLLSWKLLTDVKVDTDSNDNQDVARRNKVRATVTVLIVSGFFLFLNIFFCTALFLETFAVKHGVTTGVYVFVIIAIWLAIPQNSAVNPLIFFLRKREMRDYIKQLPRALRSRC